MGIGDKINLEIRENAERRQTYSILLSTLEKKQIIHSKEQPKAKKRDAQPKPKTDQNQVEPAPKSNKEREEKDTAGADQERVAAQQIGVDQKYFHKRQNEGHRYEIMAFIENHLSDNLWEWYQMRPEVKARLSKPQRPLPTSVNHAIKASEPNFTDFFIHQAKSLDSIRAGRNLVLVTQTASGKTLCYNPGIFEQLVNPSNSARALYIFPLNALLSDQKDKIDKLCNAFLKDGVHVNAEFLIGGLGSKRFTIAKNNPQILVVNPELLNTILKEPDKWKSFFSQLKYVVIDEVHTYRSLFGMHMAGLLRRLLLTLRRFGADPQFILSSATVSNPKELAVSLTSLPEESFDLIDEKEDGSFQANKHWLIANPDFQDTSNGYDSYLNTAALIMEELICANDSHGKLSSLNTILFAKSIREVNKVYRILQENLKNHQPSLVKKIQKYVSAELNYQKKQEIYNGLQSGQLVGVVSTNALEAGIDIGHLDACIIAGFPFWVMRMRQMAGRIGRRQEGAVIFVPHPSNAVDQYYRQNPDLLLVQPPEVFVVDPTNFYIARKHVNEAAYRLGGINLNELSIFGSKAAETASRGVRDGVMKKYRDSFHGTRIDYKNISHPYAIVSLRSQPQDPYTVCEKNDGNCQIKSSCLDGNNENKCPSQVTVLDRVYAYRDCHPEAVYESVDGLFYRVESFIDAQKLIHVIPVSENTNERTFVEENTTIQLIGNPSANMELHLGMALHLGEVNVNRQFTGYYTYTLIPKRRCRSCKAEYDEKVNICRKCGGKTISSFDQSKITRHDFPEPYKSKGLDIKFSTTACWMTVPPEIENNLTLSSPCKLPGEQNQVMRFLKEPLELEILNKKVQLSEIERDLIQEFHHGASVFRVRKKQPNEIWLYPGVYGQCILSKLRNQLSESRALQIFQGLTGYPVTDNLKHICRNCTTSALYPAMHTLEHTIFMRYPSVALGDTNDLGSYSSLGHADTGLPTIFWYDAFEGGLGAAEKVFEQFSSLLDTSKTTLSSCTCNRLEGCPRCTQIAHCSQKNEALLKPAGTLLIGLLQNQRYLPNNEPYIYSSRSSKPFEEIYREHQYASRDQGIGEEQPDRQTSSSIDPFTLLRIQHQVHDLVLKKAFEVRSTEITYEFPIVSAVQINRAFKEVLKIPRPKDWRITGEMTPYEILEILPTASPRMIQQIFRVLALAMHPDTNLVDKQQATEAMKLVNAAYDQIRKEKKNIGNDDEL